MPVHQAAAPWMSYAIPVCIAVFVMLLRFRRMARVQRLRIETLWILPAVYAVVVALVFAAAPPAMAGWGWSALALVVGAGFGWWRGRMMRITVDPATGTLSQQASPAAFLLLIVLIVVRAAARQEMGVGSGDHAAAMLATDVAMTFALGLIATTRIEMAVRARRIVAGGEGARAA